MKTSLNKNLVRAITGSAGLRFLGLTLTFLVGVQLARNLGPEGYGIYGLVISIIAILGVPSEFGFSKLVTREIAAAQARQEWGKIRGVLLWARRAVLKTSIAVGVIGIVWIFLSRGWENSELWLTLMVGMLMIPLVANCNIRCAALRGFRQVVKSELPDTVTRPALYSLLLFLAGLCFTETLTPFAAMVLATLAAAAALILASKLLKAATPPEVFRAQPDVHSKSWWQSVMPMAASDGLRIAQAHLLTIVLSIVASAEQVGIYKVSMSTLAIVTLPITLLNLTCAPFIARLYAQQEESQLRHLMSRIALLMTALVALFSAPFFLIGDQLLATFFGSSFAQANSAIIITSIFFCVSSSIGGNVVLLNMTGHQRKVTQASLISLLVTATVGYVLSAKFGYNGTAAAMGIGFTTWNLVLWISARKTLGFAGDIFILSNRPRSAT